MAAFPLTFSLVAEMVADPAATALTVPEALTAATPGLDETHDTARSVRTVPSAARTVDVRACVLPTVMLTLDGETVTEPTDVMVGGVVESPATTVSVALPLLQPRVALILAVPTFKAVTRPEDETVAIAESLELHRA